MSSAATSSVMLHLRKGSFAMCPVASLAFTLELVFSRRGLTRYERITGSSESYEVLLYLLGCAVRCPDGADWKQHCSLKTGPLAMLCWDLESLLHVGVSCPRSLKKRKEATERTGWVGG